MTIKNRIIESLLHIYPRSWRKEYGPELTELLVSAPLTMRGAGDMDVELTNQGSVTFILDSRKRF